MKVVKWILGILVAVVLILIGAVFFLLDPAVQKMRPLITAKLSDLLKTEVEIGKISASVFPTPRVELDDLKIGGKNGASLKKLLVNASISEMISGKLLVREVIIESPSISVSREENGGVKIGDFSLAKQQGKDPGQQNTQERSAGEGKNSATNSTAEPRPAQAKPDNSIDFSIEKLAISSGSVRFTDRIEGTDLKLEELTASVRDLSLMKPTQFELSFKSNVAENVSASGTVAASTLLQKQPILKISTTVTGIDLKTLKSLAAKKSPALAAIALDGKASFKGSINAANEAFNVTAEVDCSKAKINLANSENKTLFHKDIDVPLKLNSASAIAKGAIDVSAFDFSIGKNVISGSASMGDAEKSVRVSLNHFALNDLRNFIELPLKLEGALGGKLAFDLRKKPYPSIMGTLTAEKVSAQNDKVLIKDLDGSVAFSEDKVDADTINLLYNDEKIQLKGNLLTISGAQLKNSGLQIVTLGGRMLISGQLNTEDPKRPFQSQIEVSDVDLKRAFKASLGDSPFGVTGTLKRFTSTFSGTLTDHAIAGPFDMSVVNGEILGANLFGMILQKVGIPGISDSLVLLLPERFRPLASAVNSTSFNSLALNGNMASGQIIHLQQADLRHEAYRLTGSGTVGPEGRVNLKTQMRLLPSITAEMIARSKKLSLLLDRENNLTFPVIISKDRGPVVVVPDLTELGKNALRGTAKEAASKALDKVVPGLGTGAKGVLEKLF